MTQSTLLLASASPRRRELLALGGWEFKLGAVAAPEIPQAGETPAEFVQRLSAVKARLALPDANGAAFILGADTVVALDDEILGKPADPAHARHMLTRLRGRWHAVLTGFTVIDTTTGAAYTGLACSPVPMRLYPDAEMDAYIATGDPLDKAGAYAIQHPAFQLVDLARFAHCFANVMGLPLCHLLQRLRQLGLDSPADLPAACQKFIPYQCPLYPSILQGTD